MIISKTKEILSYRPSGNRTVLYLVGLTGSGKSTTAKILGEKLGAEVTPEFVDPLPDFVMNVKKNSHTETLIRAERWVIGQHAIKNDALTYDVVVDRTWLDTLIYATIEGGEVVDAVVRYIDSHSWIPGDYILLYADEDVIKERLMERYSLSLSEWNETWASHIHDLKESVLHIARNAGIFAVNTSHADPETVAEAIINYLKNGL